MAKKFTLGKDERLKSRKQLEELFAAGKKFTVAPFRISWHISKAENPSLQFGVGVSNKNFTRAVDRNRIKRLVRESWRLGKNELKDKIITGDKQLNVFFIYTGKEIPDYRLVTEKINEVISQLLQLI